MPRIISKITKKILPKSRFWLGISIVVFIGILGIGGFFGYQYLSLRGDFAKIFGRNNEEQNEETPEGKVLSATYEKKSPISFLSDNAISPALSSDGIYVNYFDTARNTFYQVPLSGSGRIRALSKKTFDNVIKVLWSFDKSRAILIEQNPNTKVVSKSLYVFSDTEYKKLSDNICYLSWKDDKRIIYHYFNSEGGESNFSEGDADGHSWGKVSDIFVEPLSKFQYVRVYGYTSNDRKIVFSVVTKQGGTLFLLNIATKEVKQVLDGNDFKLSPDRKLVLFETKNKDGSFVIKVASLEGNINQKVEILTSINKCYWSEDGTYIFYAAYKEIKNKEKPLSGDEFWKVEVNTGMQTPLTSLEEIEKKYSVREIFVIEKEGVVVFLDNDNGIYKVELGM